MDTNSAIEAVSPLKSLLRTSARIDAVPHRPTDRIKPRAKTSPISLAAEVSLSNSGQANPRLPVTNTAYDAATRAWLGAWLLSSEGVSLTAEQRLVLQAIYDHFHEHGTWPSFIAVDRPLRRTHGFDTRAIFMTLPEPLVVRSRLLMGPTSTDDLRLRLLGIQACRGGAEDTERFVRLLRWFAQKEIEFEPEPGSDETMPRVTSQEVPQYLRLDGAEDLALRRLYAMLQLDHWGLGNSGSGADGWYTFLSPDIWRFRHVQTVEDCISAREQWIAEAQATTPHMRNTAAHRYYHVRVSTKSKPSWDEVRLDLSRDELESRFLAPRREGRPIVINGATIPIADLAQLRISRTEQPSASLRPIVRAERRASKVTAPIPEDWDIAYKGEDVTDQLIAEPIGSATVPLSQSGAPPSQSSYVAEQIVDAMRAAAGTTEFNTAKLLKLIEELNDNCRRQNTYAAHALLRAMLDHIPPILGCGDFKAVANNYAWSRTDKRYMKRLLDFRDQADDALHRQISTQADPLDLDDLPASVCVDRLLQECADKL